MRRRRNKIKGLIDDHGVKQENNGVMCAMVKNYFAHLFTRENGEIDSSVLESIPRKVTDDMNEALLLPYTEQEVKEALFNIGDLKAPGPDGLHAIFYKRFWSMLGDDLVTEVLQAVNSCTIPSGWNNTTVVLIPKVENPETVAQFRPISLCNVVYKVISKMLANRLKLILPDIISEQQSAFVKGNVFIL